MVHVIALFYVGKVLPRLAGEEAGHCAGGHLQQCARLERRVQGIARHWRGLAVAVVDLLQACALEAVVAKLCGGAWDCQVLEKDDILDGVRLYGNHAAGQVVGGSWLAHGVEHQRSGLALLFVGEVVATLELKEHAFERGVVVALVLYIDLLERGHVFKGTVLHHGKRARQVEHAQAGAVGKGVLADYSHSQHQVHTGKAGAVLKRSVGNQLQCRGQFHLGERCASGKGALAHCCDAVDDAHLRQLSASGKALGTYGLEL